MRSIGIILMIWISFISVRSYAQERFHWVNRIGGQTGMSRANDVTSDKEGNTFITGHFTNAADFDPGAGTRILDGQPFGGVYLAKYDASGQLVWVQQFASNVLGPSGERGNAVATDDSGNVFIVGQFKGTLDLRTRTSTHISFRTSGGEDIFFIKLNKAGQILWAKKFGSRYDDFCYSLATDELGNIYITGESGGDMDFNPGTTNQQVLGYGIFLAKYDNNGDYIWANTIGVGAGKNVKTDDKGNVYVTGYINRTSDFDPDTSAAIIHTNGGQDIFVAKYNNDGVYLWAKGIGGNRDDFGNSIAVSSSGDVYVTGGFSGTDIDFDPGPGIKYLSTPYRNTNTFLLKLDNTGNFLWAHKLGNDSTNTNVDGQSIALTDQDDFFITGSFRSHVDFDPGPGTHILRAVAGSYTDIFIAKYNKDCEHIYSYNIAEPDAYNNSVGYAVKTDRKGCVYFAGAFSSESGVDFDPGPFNTNTRSVSGQNIFLLKFSLVPVAPIHLSGTFDHSRISVQLNWEDQSDDEDGFIVERSHRDSQAYFRIADLPSNTVSYEDASVTTNNVYLYRIVSYNDYGESYYSDIASVNTTVTDIPTLDNDPGVYLFPNPAYDYLYITSAAHYQDADFFITNIEGKVLLQGILDKTQATISTSGLPSGAYYLHINSKTSSLTKKFVVQH